MEVVRLLLPALAVSAAVLLLVLLVLALCPDQLLRRVTGGYVQWRQRRWERRLIIRLNRAVDAKAIAGRMDLAALDRADRRPLEQVAADLRCLRRWRPGRAGLTVVWHSSVLEAYDDRLRAACRALGVTEYLAELSGVDRQLERVRIEGELDAAGLRLPAARPGQPERRA